MSGFSKGDLQGALNGVPADLDEYFGCSGQIQKAIIDKNLSVEDEEALGLQAYEEILSQERPIDPNSQTARQIREIAQRLIAKTDVVEQALVVRRHRRLAEHPVRPLTRRLDLVGTAQTDGHAGHDARRRVAPAPAARY